MAVTFVLPESVHEVPARGDPVVLPWPLMERGLFTRNRMEALREARRQGRL
ncbi:hypothetical protein GCM10010103_11630 [Streptomyces paradoxus]|uniref:Uncharacterized protein n=1 Tax=Streptomyces paradoxus TaxID=66375 RepID=A0A7W9WFK3_9ACTN|nr:hypothetical protein [Streptomyces paradoxus]